MTDTETEAEPVPDSGPWAVVEIMGHRVRPGLISDATMGGATLLRIEHPTAADHTGSEPLTEYYSPQAIFAVRPCSRDEAERAARSYWPARSPAVPALPAAVRDLVDDDDDDWPEDECAQCHRPLSVCEASDGCEPF